MTEAVTVEDFRLVRETVVCRAALCRVNLGLAELIATRREFLSDEELARYDAIPVDRRRFSFLSGRFAAKRALSRLRPSLNAASFEIAAGVFGQPVLPASELHGLQVSISHTDGAAVALAFPEAHPMGLDLERFGENRDDVIKEQLTGRERILLRSLPISEAAAYMLLWTVKESLSKVLKCGMMTPFTVLEIEEVRLHQGTTWVSTFRNFAQYKALSRVRTNEILSITLPKRTELSLEKAAIE